MFESYRIREIGEMKGKQASTSFGFSFLIQSPKDLEEFFQFITKANDFWETQGESFFFDFEFFQEKELEYADEIIPVEDSISALLG